MSVGPYIFWLAALVGAALAVVVPFLRRRSVAAWLFAVGMGVLAGESLLNGMSVAADVPAEVVRLQSFSLVLKAFLPAVWMAFSVVYARGAWSANLRRWCWVLTAAAVLPFLVAFMAGWAAQPAMVVSQLKTEGGWGVDYAAWVTWLNMVLVASSVSVLANLERTFRAAVGTMQWRIKYVVLGLGLIFGARIYCRSQALLFSNYDLNLGLVESLALVLGSALVGVGYLRRGFGDIDIYPSRTVLQSSVVVVLVGSYLFVVGVLAHLAKLLGGTGNFQLQALVVLAGMVGLAILLLSDRLRQLLTAFVGRHFQRPEHDSRAVWTQFTRHLSQSLDRDGYGREAVRLVAGTFKVLSVTLWLVDEGKEALVLGASTAKLEGEDTGEGGSAPSNPITSGLLEKRNPFDLDAAKEPWAETLRHLSLRHFPDSGNRLAVPLLASGRVLGLIILADRVNGVPYSVEELDLLKCIGDHVAAGLLQLRLTDELMHGRELEAFQAMSTFFVHDLKNAASSLSLMLQNLPEHFDDPEFRADALRGIGSTVTRINQIIERLGSLRQKLEMRPVATDLNQMVNDILAEMGGLGDVHVVRQLSPLPPVPADAEHLSTVLTNLLLNAREAIGPAGQITVATAVADGRAVLTVSDTGRGMTPEFMRTSLFRPFQTTKKKGLGIGLFQSKLIVEAHRGVLQVQSTPGTGTTFRLLLPLAPSPA